jgi:predicted dithiol-disulfide oxidoreductase (DUF899 family)
MSNHQIVSHEEWIAARQRFLAKERAFTRLRDELSRERRELPWESIEKEYVFESENGMETLADLFGMRSQLIVYHFMYDPGWEIGCRSCSFWADNFNGIVPHLNQRDTALVAVSRARGLDMFNTAYHYLDIAPKGRDEDGLPYPMAWVKHRIAYES